MTILVTGATGNVGHEVVNQLIQIGEHVRAAVHSKDKGLEMFQNSVEVVEFEYRHPDTIRNALVNVDKVFMVTPLTPDMVSISQNLVHELKVSDVKHVVKLSGLGAQTEGITLAKWHRQVEKMIEATDIPFTFLRPNSFMQNYLGISSQTIKSQNAFYLPVGDGKVSLVDARDIALAVSSVLTSEEHHGKAYDITGSEALSNQQISEIFSSLLKKNVTYVDIPEERAYQTMVESGMAKELIDALMELYAINKAGYASHVSKAFEQITGRKPTTFAQFVEDHILGFSQNLS